MRKTIHALRFARIDAIFRHVKMEALPAEFHGIGRRIPSLDEGDSAARSAELIPHRVGRLSQRRHDAQTRDYYTTLSHAYLLACSLMQSTAWPTVWIFSS